MGKVERYREYVQQFISNHANSDADQEEVEVHRKLNQSDSRSGRLRQRSHLQGIVQQQDFDDTPKAEVLAGLRRALEDVKARICLDRSFDQFKESCYLSKSA